MKKLLAILGAVGLTASSSVLVVSCGNKNSSDSKEDKKVINSEEIKNFIENSEEIKNLPDLAAVNTKLTEILNSTHIDGVVSLTAAMKNGLKTDVTVTVAIDEANYNLVGGSTFVIEKAIKDYNKTDIDIKLIQSKLIQDIQNLNSIDEFKTKLNDEMSQFEGVTSLEFSDFYNKIYTDLIVKVKVNEEKYNLIGSSEIVIKGALKKATISVKDVQNLASGSISNLDSLEQVNAALQKILETINNIHDITFIESVNATVEENSKTDVIVTLKVNENNVDLIGGNSFEIVGAIHIQPKTFQPTIYINENGEEIITYETNIFNINTKEIKQIGFFKNKQNKIEVIKMPKTIEKVPNELPKEITNLSYMFYGTTSFNQDISAWDTSNVTNMQSMFQQAYVFNQDISAWDTSNVTDMSYMFNISKNFNQDISAWDTSNVTDMSYMFSSAQKFNQNILEWDVSKVTNMESMFQQAYVFNQDISKWNTSNVTNMGSMFWNSISFNQDISKWDVSKVIYMEFMFDRAYNFNQDISKWDVSKVIYMYRMFENSISFNQDISKWDVSSVKDYYNFDKASNSNWTNDKKPNFIKNN